MNSRDIFAAGAALLAASVAMIPGPAVAGNPGLVRAMAHCGTLNDPTQRLGCYDALEPQVQAALSAPATSAPASAPAAAAAPAAAVAAGAVPTAEQQESWFGRNVGSLFGDRAPARQTTPKKFGADSLPAEETKAAPNAPREIDSITAKVTKYAFNPYGKFVVYLANGQVWRQLQGDTEGARFRHNPGDNTVTISRGFIGSYNMTMNGSSRLYKVARIK